MELIYFIAFWGLLALLGIIALSIYTWKENHNKQAEHKV